MCWINVPQYTILVPNAEELAILGLYFALWNQIADWYQNFNILCVK